MRRVFVLVSLLFTLSAFAQTPVLPKMTWVRYYQVERGKEADFMRLAHDAFKPVLDDLRTKNKVVDWGLAFPITHNSDPWTHVLYIAMPDWSGAEALDQAIDKAQASMTPEVMKRTGELGMSIREGGTRDVILRHVVQATTPPAAPPKYIMVETHKIKPGRDGDAVQLFNEWAKPMFTDLAAKGVVGPWGLSVHGVAGAADWTHMVWYFMPDLGNLETVIAANDAVEARKRQGFMVRYLDMSEGMNEQVWRIVQP